MPKTAAIILARGGSKGIPNKNIYELNGHPLLYYTIKAALDAGCDEVWVSSDSQEILDVAAECGAKTLVRPDEISGDKSKSEDALVHFTQEVDYDQMVFIQPTSPMVKAEHIKKGLEMMADHDSVFTAFKEHWIPRWNMKGEPHEWDINNRPMRQDKEELWVENGAFYITTRENFTKTQLRYGGNIGIVEMQQSESFQIDTYDDIRIIETLMSK